MGKSTFSLLIFILLSVSCRNREIKKVPDEAVPVRLAGITTKKISIPVHSTGVIISSKEFKLSFKTGGLVEKIFVKEGDRVKKGELLASLNLSEIRASTDQAESNYIKALRDYTRAENLYRDSVVTLEQKQNAATLLSMAKSTLEIVRFNLTHSRIIAPDNGLILKLLVRENELLSSGYPVFLFGSEGKYWKVKTGLSDKDIVKINRGDSALIIVDAFPGEKFFATVDQVGEMANPYTGTYEVEMTLQENSFRLASGFITSVDLFPSSKKAYSMIPVESIVEADGREGYIYIVTGSMTVQKVRINIEALIGSMAAVTGIPDGIIEVVSEGAAYLKNGMKVGVIK